MSSALIFPSLIPLQPPLTPTWPRLGGKLDLCFIETTLLMVRTRLFGLRLRDWSHAQEPWMGEYDPVYGSLVLCSILCSISGTCRLVCFTSCFRLSAVMTSLVDTRSRLGWDPWIVWPSRRFLWEPPWSSGLQHCNSRTCGSFLLSVLGRGRLLLRKGHGYLRISMC